MKRLGIEKEKGRENVVVKLGSEKNKMEVMKKKGSLRGREERVSDDWTLKEKRMRWNLKRIARKERIEEESLGKIWQDKD